MMKKLTLIACICLLAICGLWLGGATTIRGEKVLAISAVDATPLDGTTSGLQYISGDRVTAYSVRLSERCDAVSVKAYCAGSDGGTAVFKIWGYSSDGPAELIYSGTGTVGTAVFSTGNLWIDTFTAAGTNHIASVSVRDSGNNRICKLNADTTGYRDLMFEATVFTNVTAINFQVREYGYK